MDDIFRVSKDANGQPVYTHNNEIVPKDVFDQRNQASKDEMNAMRNRVIPGIDDDPDIAEMRAKAQAMQAARIAAKKAIPKAKGGNVKSSLNPKRKIHPNW